MFNRQFAVVCCGALMSIFSVLQGHARGHSTAYSELFRQQPAIAFVPLANLQLYSRTTMEDFSLLRSASLTIPGRSLTSLGSGSFQDNVLGLTRGQSAWILRRGHALDEPDLSDPNVRYALERALNSRRVGNILMVTGAGIAVVSGVTFGVLIPVIFVNSFFGNTNGGGALALSFLGIIAGITVEIVGISKRLRANGILDDVFREF